MGGFAGSKILEVHGERMIKGTFDPGFRISLHQKDLNLALSGARELDLNLPNTVFVALAVWQPSNLWLVSAGLAL